MAILPATGSEMAMGRVKKAYTNSTPVAGVNLLSNPTAEVIGSSSEFVQYRDIASIFNTYGINRVYSLSLDLRAAVAGNVYVYMQNGSTTKYSFVAETVNATTTYQRFYFPNLTPAISNPSDVMAILAFYGGYGSGVIPSIKNVQIEFGPVCTTFSATEIFPVLLSSTLGANYGGKTAGTQISLTATFGGKTTPYAY
jgi:hypothetical protein